MVFTSPEILISSIAIAGIFRQERVSRGCSAKFEFVGRPGAAWVTKFSPLPQVSINLVTNFWQSQTLYITFSVEPGE